MSDSKAKSVFLYIEKHPDCSTQDIMKALFLYPSQISTILSKLREQGLIGPGLQKFDKRQKTWRGLD